MYITLSLCALFQPPLRSRGSIFASLMSDKIPPPLSSRIIHHQLINFNKSNIKEIMRYFSAHEGNLSVNAVKFLKGLLSSGCLQQNGLIHTVHAAVQCLRVADKSCLACSRLESKAQNKSLFRRRQTLHDTYNYSPDYFL